MSLPKGEGVYLRSLTKQILPGLKSEGANLVGETGKGNDSIINEMSHSHEGRHAPCLKKCIASNARLSSGPKTRTLHPCKSTAREHSNNSRIGRSSSSESSECRSTHHASAGFNASSAARYSEGLTSRSTSP